MQFTDGQGLVHIIAGTGLLTGMMADPSTDTGKRVVLFEQFQRLAVLSVIDQGNVALDAYMSRAGGFAGGRAAFADAESSRDRLGVLFEDGFTLGQAFVVFIGQSDGANFGALATAGALRQVHKAGLLVDGGAEISGISLEIQKFGVGEQFDVQVPADLDQFRRNHSHRTVIGGERLVELGHEPPDGGRLLDKIDVITRFCQIQRRLHTGDAGTHYHH